MDNITLTKLALSKRIHTQRLIDVGTLVTAGLSNNEIANQLFMSEQTVKFYLPKLYVATNTTGRANFIVTMLCEIGFFSAQAGA